ncbi:MAG: peptidylprolyl isomerase [Gemmatimonadetes bacterium]|nr:peptidylprolyl isomerase [Gemmatimonadota bacterium]
MTHFRTLLVAVRAAVAPLAVLSALPGATLAQSARALTRHAVLAAEHAREAGLPVLDRALASGDTTLQALALRALGRLGDGQQAGKVSTHLAWPAASVRLEAARAALLMGLPLGEARLRDERDPVVRAALFESFGRAPVDSGRVVALVNGLAESDLVARRGAMRGLEMLLRRNARTWRAPAPVLAAVRRAFVDNSDAELRMVGLLALTAAGDRDSSIVARGLSDADAQVRRTTVALYRVWVADDRAPMVRWQGLRAAPTCEHATQRLRDSSWHVALLALDVLGERRCDKVLLQPFLSASTPWRQRAHATMALARIDSVGARGAVRELASSPVWQARAWAAEAAKVARDTATLHTLAADPEPNVAAAAITTDAEAIAALTRDHAGVLLAAATQLGKARAAASVAPLRAAFERITRAHGVTWRDPRVAIIEAMPLDDDAARTWMRRWLADADPGVAAAAAKRLSAGGTTVAPTTQRYAPPAFPTAAALAALEGATATIRFRNVGDVTLRLRPDIAPMTVYTFVREAEAKRYAGNTIHRIVPNFVIQGGSPGADEYDPVTRDFMRDEVGGRHARGTFGISTRGKDTGDGQIFVNLIDNVRLDWDYTMFAETVRGLDVIDRIQEGDVIESITITRRAAGAR